MAYPPYTHALLLFLPLALATAALYLTRDRWSHLVPSLPGSGYLYSRLPTSFSGASSSATFAGDVEAGLSSATFDLSGNVAAGDARAGLDADAKAEILRIMKKRRMRFDEARRVYMEGRFRANGIAPDGRPRDPKFVSFS